MKRFSLLIILSSFLLQTQWVYADGGNRLAEYLEKKQSEASVKIKEVIANQDINFELGLGDIDLIDGINIAGKYRYNVESSYISKYYTRIDKWNLRAGVNVGEVIKDYVDLPFSFSINRDNSIYFVRQFPTKLGAMKAIPYTPAKLPVTASRALKSLNAGDMVSMPANLNIAVSLGTSTSMGTPGVPVNANASIYGILSGEFVVQVYKIDQTHVRLKLIAQRSRTSGSSYGMGLGFNFFGISFVDRQIKRLVDTDLVQLGFNLTPQSQFIVDYVFDLSDAKAQEAYNQILSSQYKFKDLLVTEQMLNAKELKDKLISSYEKADNLWSEDRSIEPDHRRIQRIFKGFNSSKGHTRHVKLALLVTSYQKDNTYTESKVSVVDKNENNLDFYYPTFSRYLETTFGKKWFLNLKDQSYFNNFGLIPRFNTEDSKLKNPDIGFTYERKDKFFTSFEQKAVEKFLLSQIPLTLLNNIDLGEWSNGLRKVDSRIFLQLILKAQGFEYLKNFSETELIERLLAYVKERESKHVIEVSQDDANVAKIKDFLFINRFIEKKRLTSLARSLYTILKNENNDSEEMTRRIVALNEFGVFDRIGVGFLISLLPQDQLANLVYVKLEMSAKDTTSIDYEAGKLNYRALYKELTTIQSRLSNRSYDMRVTDEDRNMEEIELGHLNGLED